MTQDDARAVLAQIRVMADERLDHDLWGWATPVAAGEACPTLGEAAARALLAIHNGGTP